MPPLDATPQADTPPPGTFQPNPDYVPAYILEPAVWKYSIDQTSGSSNADYQGLATSLTAPPGTNTTQLATTAFVTNAVEAATAGVSSFNTRTGAVTLLLTDIMTAGGAPSLNPALTGTPTAPTAAPGTNTTQLASTAFVTGAVNAVAANSVTSFNGRQGAVTLTLGDVTGVGGAPTASPALTGTPTAPTATMNDASSKIATTQFVANQIAGGAVVSFNGRQGVVNLTLSDVQSVGGAPIASPNFTGTPAGPTAAPGTNTTQLASTAFVTAAVNAATTGVSSFNTRTGAVTLQLTDVTGVGGAPIASPALTGTPTAPTPTGGDNSTKIATTAFVDNALASIGGVTTFNGRAGTVTLQLADVTSVGGAPLASPAFTGSPTTTTAPPGDNSTRVADTAFVAASYAPLASPALTGTPTAPTAAPGTNTTQLASTAFVAAAVPAPSNANPLVNGVAAPGTGTTYARTDHVHPTDTTRAPAASPTLSGTTTTTAINNSGLITTGTLQCTSSFSATVSGWAYTSTGGAASSGTFAFGISAGSNSVAANFFFAVSDRRLKQDIETLTAEAGIEWVRKSRPVTYRKLDNQGAGFISQEQIAAGYSQYVAPMPWHDLPEETDDAGVTSAADVSLHLSYDNYIAYLTAALKAVLDRLDHLEGRTPPGSELPDTASRTGAGRRRAGGGATPTAENSPEPSSTPPGRATAELPFKSSLLAGFSYYDPPL